MISLVWNLKTWNLKVSEQTRRYREETDGCQVGRVLSEKGEGIKLCKWPVTVSGTRFTSVISL